MTTGIEDTEFLAAKDEREHPIPFVWRPIICEIVKAFARKDYQLSTAIPGVAPISTETAVQIERYILSYGATLIELPNETWESSVCIWAGSRWDALIDLWTLSEGRSDLVLSLHILETNSGFTFHIYMVYVP